MADFPLKIENVVAVAMLGVNIPLKNMISSTQKTEYEAEHSSGVVYKPADLDGVAALIFSSGKVICTGSKSVDAARDAINKVVDKIRENGIDVPGDFEMKIESIVASSKVKNQLKLEELATSLENAEYEPNRFPGLIYRMSEPKVSFLLFPTGKIICTGAQSVKDVQKALRRFMEKLKGAGVKADVV